MSKENDYDSEDDEIPELDSVSSSEYEMEEKLEVGKETGGGEEKEEKEVAVYTKEADDAESDRMRTIKETIEMLDLDGKGDKPQPDWVKSIDLQQYNGLAVVTIPGTALTRTTEYASRWLKYDDKRSSAIKAYLLSPFLYGHAHQSDKWLDWCSYGKLLKQSSNYNTQALSSVELVVVEALEIAANECLAMLEDDTNMKSKMEDVYNQSEKILNFYQMLRIVEETEWLRLLVKKITPNVDDKDKEELQPNGLNAVAFCTVVHVYEYKFKRNDLPDFLDEFEEQCINDEKDSEQLKLKGNELFQAGKFAEAIACYSEAIVLYPFNAFLYSNRAACYLRTKDFAAALSDGYRAIVLRRDWYKGYSRYVEALAHTNNKKATALFKELTTSKFRDPTEMDQLQSALQKPKEKEAPPAATSAAKAPSAARKASTANKDISTTTAPIAAATTTATDTRTNKEIAKKTEPRTGTASSKKSATVAAKQTEKKETAKEAYRKQTTKESTAKAATKDSSKDLEVIKTLPNDVLEIVTNDGSSKETVVDEEPEIENNSVAIFTSTRTTIKVVTDSSPSAIEKAVANVAPPHIANINKKTQEKPTARSEVTLSTKSSVTSSKTGSNSSSSISSSNTGNANTKTSSNNSTTSSSNSNISSSATVKEKDKSKDKERLRKDSESKLSKGDHKLKKNVMFNLQHASKALIDKKYHNAIKLYETALNEIEKHKAQWHSIMNQSEHNKLMVTIHYCLGTAVWHQRREDYIITAMMHFRIITTRYSSIIFIPAYYHLGMANAALHHYQEALKDVHNGLNHIMRSRSTSVFNYPGMDEVIEESNAHIIENKLRQLKHRCSPKTIVEAYCRYRNCLQYHISTDIVRDDAEFKGYVAISCTERCVTTFHSLCWRKVREENVDIQASDKEHLGEPCITDGCNGVIKAIKHYEGLGRPKIIAQSEPTSETTVKKDTRPSKLNRTKPSSSKKLAKITQRRQEKVAEWRLRKEREIMATQSSYDSSVATQTSVESVNNELHNATTTPDIVDNREDAGTPGDLRKGLEIRVGKVSGQDDAESKLKNKARKRSKVKQREKEIVLTGFISEHTGISANDEIDESGNVQKANAWNVNEEAPFSVPPHLRDQHSTFEGLLTAGGGAALPGASTPEVDVVMNSAEADNLLSYFVEIMDKHGPMEINDERLIGQLTILPENSQALIQNFGGLEKFLLSSTSFVKQGGLICLAEYADVVAASMNSNEDMLPTSLDSSNLMSRSSREEELQEYNVYRLRQKGLAKDPILASRKPSNMINGVARNKPLYSSGSNGSKNEVGIKKNSNMPQQASRQGIHTSTPPPGLTSNSIVGKPPLINKSPYTHSNNNDTSLESAGRKTTNNTKYHNGKESLSSISSSLDPIDNSLIFSSTKKVSSGPLNSTSTEHSQEGPSGEDDGLMGNLFEYNAFGTGSSGNYLSPSNEGYFPNAYPQEQMDSSSFLSEITMPAADTEVKSKPGFGKKSSSSRLESAITASNIMDSSENTKLLTSGLDMKATAKYGKNTSASSGNTSIPYNSGGRHMEPVYLPPPPIQQPAVTVNKKDACVETDEVYIYYENFKEKYETAMKSHGEVLKRLEESEDRRVQMNKSHAIEQEQAIRRAQESTKKECQQQIENYKEQMNEEGRRYMAEKRELQEGMKSFKIEIKSLNEKSEKLKKDLQAKTAESQSNFIRYQADMESAHKEKKKAEDRLKNAMDAQQQSLQRAMDAEIQMLTMMREFTVKEVDRRIIECDSICSRLPSGSEVQKEWLMYKENMKATVEQYKTSVESHIEEVKQGKTLSSLGPLKITPPQPPQLPFAMGPSTGVQAQAPPPQAPAAMYQMMPQQQMAQGQNVRAQMQPPPQPAAATMQAGYQIRPSYHMTQQGGVATAVAPPSQQWGNIMEQQVTQPVMQQPEMAQQEMQNGITGGAANQQNATDSAPKQQSSFERIVERMSVEYPTYTRDEFKAVLKQVREQQGRLTNRSIDSIMQQMREVINAKEMAAASNLTSTQPISQQIATPTTVGSNESPTPSSNAGKVATPKKPPAEKVTVRTLPKKQGPRYLVPPHVTPPKKPNLNPAYFPVYEDDNECIICQEDMRDSNSLKLQCGHRFHKACINSWFKEQSTCPTCRRHALLPEEYPVLGQ